MKDKFDLFDKIWHEVVEPLVDTMVSNESCLKNYVRVAKIRAKRCYSKESQIFVKSYMVDETKNIDRHKIASCMMKSILVSKPIRIIFIEKVRSVFGKLVISDKAYLANQYLAMSVATTILDGYIESDPGKQIKHKIHFPEPFPDGLKDYVRDVCLDLYYTSPHKINTITYANVFFLLEKYSCRRIQCDNLENKCRELLVECNKDYSDAEVNSILDSIRLKSEETKNE